MVTPHRSRALDAAAVTPAPLLCMAPPLKALKATFRLGRSSFLQSEGGKPPLSSCSRVPRFSGGKGNSLDQGAKPFVWNPDYFKSI